MIVGTAGHIDHGKTTLVRALTGVDTDRLKEEKARGISIELGYAYIPLRDGNVLGFIDVPGHERLVHTMTAGATGIDFALLVVAADDGVMPQTREHLAILTLLRVSRGAVVITKRDRADDARRAEVRSDITRLIVTTPLRNAEMFEVDARDENDDGVLALRAHLASIAHATTARRSDGYFRLAIDRVFSLSGHGTIVTGTAHSGKVGIGDELALMPRGQTVRVRGIHAQNRASEIGVAGQRCAINIVGPEVSETTRGDWLADPASMSPTTRIDVRLHLLRDAKPIHDWTAVHVHLGTRHSIAHIVPLQSHVIDAGTSARAQLVFDEPQCVAAGDRFILRDARAAHTIGGGSVIDPNAPARKRRSDERMRYLDAIEAMLDGKGFDALIDVAEFGFDIAQLAQLSGLPNAGSMTFPSGTRFIETSRSTFIFAASRWNALIDRVTQRLRQFHDESPDDAGVDLARLRRLVAPTLAEPLWRAVVDAMLTQSLLARTGPWLHLPDHRVTMSSEESKLAQKIRPLIAAGKFDPPWVRELAAKTSAREERVRLTLRKLLTQGVVYQVVPDLFYDRERVRELASVAADIARERGAVEAATFRDALGVGRKRSIQILEFFDRVGYTRRVRDSHRVRDDVDPRERF